MATEEKVCHAVTSHHMDVSHFWIISIQDVLCEATTDSKWACDIHSPYLKYYESFMHGRRRAPLEYYAELYN